MSRALFLLFVLLSACAPPSPFQPGAGAVVDINVINRAACGRLDQFDETTGWTPSGAVISELERALHERLVSELARDAEFFSIEALKPDEYYRRYAGVILEGKQVVVICGEAKRMYDELEQDWRTTTIPYRDGGSISFGAHYDPAAAAITYFEFGFVA
jgi:hypothetical protein